MARVFQMKYRPHGEDRYEQFLKEGIVGIGWPGIGNLKGQTKEEIKKRLKEIYGLDSGRLGNALGAVWCFTHSMQEESILLIRYKKKVSIGILGPYQYIPSLDNKYDGFCHQRTIEWVETNENLSLYNEAVQTIVRSPGIVTGSTYQVEDLKIPSLLIKEKIK
ncbi:hypothetical protein [Metabacillus fastidiosus]|uniref:hypothetical protein n=1 Tax=Metabacillus fastidiosus TaxID=1458 RepID=UPI003D2A2508